MAEERTRLSAVKKGSRWRAEIAWPNGSKSYVGWFDLESDANKWIDDHHWLTNEAVDMTDLRRGPAPKQPQIMKSD